MSSTYAATPTTVGRYVIYDAIAAGGMATVHLARLAGPIGFSRVVAVKRLHPHLLKDGEFAKMFLDEAHLAARVRHPNVVPTLDVLVNDGEIILVMEYVHGESLLALRQLANQQLGRIPIEISAAIMLNVLQGLHAAHEARDEQGKPLRIVHRDVSPHNVLVGADGVARVLDFGVAKAILSCAETQVGRIKGKHSYMAPEVLRGKPATRQADIFAAATVFWELLTGQKLFVGATDHERMLKIISGDYPSPALFVSGLSPVIAQIVMKGLAQDLHERYATALEMAVDLESSIAAASQRVVGEWVSEVAAQSLAQRAALLQQIEISDIETIIQPEIGSADPEANSRALALVSPIQDYAVGVSNPASLAHSRRRFRQFVAVAAGLLAVVMVVLAFLTAHREPKPARATFSAARMAVTTARMAGVFAGSAASAGIAAAVGGATAAAPAPTVTGGGPSPDDDFEEGAAASGRPTQGVPPVRRSPARGAGKGYVKDFLPDDL